MRRLLLPLFVLALAAPLCAQDTAALDEIRVAMAAGDHQGAVRKIDKLLFPAPQDPALRYQLQMLKGECRLQLKDRMGALSAFKSAAKAGQNTNELAAARANAIIVERSNQGRYMPKPQTGGQPIDIMDLESRKRAMTALQQDLWSQYKPQIDAALEAKQLAPIEKVFTQVADMFFLETFATGNAKEMTPVMQALGGHTFKLMQAEVTRCAQRVDFLTQLANSSGSNARGWDTGRLGLTSVERDEVKQMLPYLIQIRLRATEYRGIAAKLGGNEAKWDALVADTVATLTDAESLYNDR